MLGVSTAQREIVACKSPENKKRAETEIPDFDSFSFLYEVLCNDFPTVDTRADRATIAQTKKAKIRGIIL